MTCNFSKDHYVECLQLLKGKDVGPVGEIHDILLRHDIDFSISLAHQLAKIEHDNGIRSSYMVMVNNPLYNPFTIEHRQMLIEMISWGHEIGLHYHPEIEQVHEFARMLSSFLDYPIMSVVRDGLFSQKKVNPPEGFLDCHTLASDWKYISDSGMNWRENCQCQWIPTNKRLQILTHPIWHMSNIPEGLPVWDIRDNKITKYSFDKITTDSMVLNGIRKAMRVHQIDNSYL